MSARTGEQFLDGLRHTNRCLYLEGERMLPGLRVFGKYGGASHVITTVLPSV